MLEGTWKFIMFYEGTDGNNHKQVAKHEMGLVAFPAKPTSVNLIRIPGYVTVSWSAIGNPWQGPLDYRVRIYGENNCIIDQFFGNWRGGTGVFDGALNRVVFDIPEEYIGRVARLENRFIPINQMSRACQYISITSLTD